jgi:cell division protein FtsZ
LRIQLSQENNEVRAVIKVIGVGGAGGNAVNRMAAAGVQGVELIAANSDAQDLGRSQAEVRVQIGEKETGGRGVGGDPVKGRRAVIESEEQIREVLHGADMVFVTTGMGGGTGTGGAPVVAQIARELGALTVGVVTRPFGFEGLRRAGLAEEGIQEMRKSVDTLLVIPNDRLFDIADMDTASDKAFEMADEVLRKAVQSISDVITTPGQINMDMNDLRAIMKDAGDALIGLGEADGKGRALQGAKAAVQSPLLENVVIDGAKGLIVNITCRRGDLKLMEIEEIMAYITGQASPDAKVKFGKAYDDTLEGGIRITVIATGFPPRRGGRGRLSGLRPEAAARAGLHSDGSALDSRLAATSAEDLMKPAFMRLKVRKLK